MKNTDNKPPSPPAFGQWLLKRMSYYEETHANTEAMREEYTRRLETSGRITACAWYYFQTIFTMFYFLKLNCYWGTVMLKNYPKSTFRSLYRQKSFSLINILGLSIGIAAALLIMLWIQDELSYDRYHKNADRIYRIRAKGFLAENKFDLATSPPPLAAALKREYPEVTAAGRLKYFFGYGIVVRYKKTNSSKGICYQPIRRYFLSFHGGW